MSYLDHARYRSFDGVVVACIDFNDPEVLELINSEIPVVTIDHTFNSRTAIVSDNAGGMRELTSYILKKGHRRIAYIHGTDSAVTKNRLTSFYKTMEDADVDVPDEYIREAAYRSVQEAYDRTKELLVLDTPPTCILYPDDLASIGGMNAIREAGFKIPEDISIAGYDGIQLSQYMAPQLTTWKQDTEKIGSKAAKELISMIESPKTTGIRQIVIGGSVQEGGTVRQLTDGET